ncbi:hypothetical protein PTTG_08102 [Puccinia triticina 1-1 BBBD Race 1]|uniref:Uncharacterized protein n=1 Tax=Puccinia triticina (isolate 1-1 / race 1 (BBBD)) TaxID=630390 RepID=A0A180GXC3_PUCT1|nr:hypothetical protein PTTG_08102 [Puccinia triticina 1-1 BBBD Race 1]
MRTVLHQRNLAERDATENGDTDVIPVLTKNMESGHLDREQANELELDSIGLEENTSSTASESDCEPFEGLDPAVYSLFDNSVDPDGDANGEISWDDYLFEALNQLADEPVPWEFLTKKRPKSRPTVMVSLQRKGVSNWLTHDGLYAPHHVLQHICTTPPDNFLDRLQASTLEDIGEGACGYPKNAESQVASTTSILNNECYSVSLSALLKQELSNPYVNPHLDFYPEDSHGLNVYKSSQSTKWLKELPPEMRAPMAANPNGQHFYVFEPAQLRNGDIVVPLFFYKDGFDSQLYAKCAIPTMDPLPGQNESFLHIPAKLQYDSELLVSIQLAHFDLIYSEIYMGDGGMLSDWCSNQLWEIGSTATSHKLPHPWREPAKGRVIRQMPINLFADDTSGNVSKQWNCHISYYCTLAGLPPKATNMQYNCHFLSTSNQAGVLELGEQIVEELNLSSSEGFPAYDPGLDADVLVMSFVLCFQGDSPMHAEVTNTMMPNVALNPCRMCMLHVDNLNDKHKQAYIREFLHIDSSGEHCPVASRNWEYIKEQSVELWELAQDGVKCHYDDPSKEKGICDTINRRFVEKLFDKANPKLKAEVLRLAKEDLERLFNSFLKLKGFDGCKDTPVEILHVFLLGIVKYMTRNFLKALKPPQLARFMASWEAFDIKSLNISSIQSKYWMSHYKSLVGKDFKIIIQTAPFVLFQFMTNAQHSLWGSLCTLATLIFKTHIANMLEYLTELRKHIRIFLWHSIHTTAQWINRPKLHMLLHLPESIERFGPPSLFSTENFESFNSLLRNASVHSNRLQPGRDIGLRFLDFQALRSITSRARLENHETHTQFYAADEVTAIFSQNSLIQMSMGYNNLLMNPGNGFPHVMQIPLTKQDVQSIPLYFDQMPNTHPKQVCQLRLSKKDIIKRGFFVLLAPGPCGQSANQIIGRVESLWECRDHNRVKYLVRLIHFHKEGVSTFYNMRCLTKSATTGIHSVLVRHQGVLELQHDCFSGSCSLTLNTDPVNKNKEAAPAPQVIKHSDDQHFILNSAAL